ncbi:MAG: GHKL domain-containing protein, partial [Elusimicrobia bacterium]|nr:GHKL domain-containing protein [Elusimicrobiota bacterium]
RHLREKISEIERAREKEARLNADLNRTKDQLVQSEKLAAIGQLAAGVAHEINNPLAYVISNLETLQEYIKTYQKVVGEYGELEAASQAWTSLEDARMGVAETLERAETLGLSEIERDLFSLFPELLDGLDRVKRIVMDLRAFARSDKDVREMADVGEIVERTIKILGEAGRRVRVETPEEPIPLIACYPQRLSQVVMNLLVNALQAAPVQGGDVVLRMSYDDDALRIEVEDNGPGIQIDDKKKIFDPFFTTKPVGQGVGLGLSISYEIVKKHGGDIQVSSEPGRGTRFVVTIPRTVRA